MATQIGPSPRSPEYETPRRRKINVTAFYPISKVSEDFKRILQKHDITGQFTPADRNWSTPRTKHQDTNRAMSSMLYIARRNAMNWGN